MPQTISEIMTPDLVSLPESATLADAARAMRDESIGDVLLVDSDDHLIGVVTDRDLVVRGMAAGLEADTPLTNVASSEPICVEPSDSTDHAIRLMAEHAIRRVPVVDNGRAVGIVAIGDLAQELDPNSVLAGISAAAPNR